uniref:Uncharacterized protein n=1 Tax=Physcomitrium patens TaxID=3218 RepID=A0A2K1K6D2_PHYPA|nr:hypothetical protein PHYPA_011232 [Physcomitrium patens]
METNDLKSLTVEYRRDCHFKTIFESLTSSKLPLQKEEPSLRDGIFDTGVDQYGNNGTPRVDRNGTTLGGSSNPAPNCQFLHLLQYIEGSRKLEIVRARTTWRPKQKTELVTRQSFNPLSSNVL